VKPKLINWKYNVDSLWVFEHGVPGSGILPFLLTIVAALWGNQSSTKWYWCSMLTAFSWSPILVEDLDLLEFVAKPSLLLAKSVTYKKKLCRVRWLFLGFMFQFSRSWLTGTGPSDPGSSALIMLGCEPLFPLKDYCTLCHSIVVVTDCECFVD